MYGSTQLLLSLTFKTSDSHWLKKTHHKCIFKVSTKDNLLSPTFLLIMKIKFHFTSGDFGQSYFSFIQEVAIKKKTKAILCCQFLWLKFRYITYTCEVDKVILKKFPLTELHFWGQLFIWSKYKKMPLLTRISHVCWPQLLFYIQIFSMYQHVWMLISLSLCIYFGSRSKRNWELSFNLQCRTFQVRILVCSTWMSHLFVGDSISLLAQLTSHTHTNHWRWE